MNKKKQHEKNRVHNQVRQDEININALNLSEPHNADEMVINFSKKNENKDCFVKKITFDRDEKLFIHTFHHMELFLRERIRINNYKLSNL